MTVRLFVSMKVGRMSDLGWSSVLISGMRKAREEVVKRRVVDSNMIAVWQNLKSVCGDDLVVVHDGWWKVSSCREEEEEGLTYSATLLSRTKHPFVSVLSS